ncbi:serine/threonine-protein phosphatase Pgam5, mitochondrial-like isoform X1 [Amblyomma americanum]
MLGHFVKGAGILGGGIAALVFHVGEAGRRRASASWTTSYQPTAQWNSNWDRRDPELCVRPPADSSEQEKSRYNEEVKKAKPMATRYLYLVRHGEFNVYEQLDSDRTLTKLGRQQAELTGQRLKQLGVPFTSLVHSTMTRAVETAGLIHEHLKQVPVTSCELIREGEPMPPEPPFGIWKPQSKFFADSARIEAGFRKHFHRAPPCQKEDSHEIIVGHANAIRYFVCRALQVPPEAWSRMSLAHCSISVVKIAPTGKVSLRSLGDAGHLAKEFISAG